MLRDVGEADSLFWPRSLRTWRVIYSGFREYIESHYITAEEILDILCRELPKWGTPQRQHHSSGRIYRLYSGPVQAGGAVPDARQGGGMYGYH